MNKFQAILAAAICGATALNAQDVADNISVSTTFAFENSYVFRGAQLAEETFMPAIDFSADNVYFGVWGALPVGDETTEVDIYGGYGFELSEIVSLDVGGTYYTYPDSETFDNGNSFEIYAGASFDVLLSPAVYVFYDFDLENITVEGSAGYSYPLSDSLSADASVFAGWVSLGNEDIRSDDFDDYFYYGASAALSYALAENASLSGYVNFSGSSEEQMYGNDKTEVWYGVSVTTGF